MRTIDAKTVHDRVVAMLLDAARNLPEDALRAFRRGLETEPGETGREIFRQLLDNACYASESGLPLCQDTGTAVFFVEHGEDARVEGGLNATLTKAMVDAYQLGHLRKSMCHPLLRKNTGDNTPAVIHTELVPGDQVRIAFLAKGGGSENMSRCTMLTPSQGWPGIKEFIVKRIAESGSNPCPPVVVGVGIGGTFDTAPIFAKKALLRDLDDTHPDPEIAAFEAELLESLNRLNIGPMGLGGLTTCLAVKIHMAPCHIASLPLAVNVQCHSIRHREVVL